MVEPQTIDLGSYFEDDEDWLQFWGTTRYLTSFLIYINLIMMLYNKYKWLLGATPSYSQVSSFVGDVGKDQYHEDFQAYARKRRREINFKRFKGGDS